MPRACCWITIIPLSSYPQVLNSAAWFNQCWPQIVLQSYPTKPYLKLPKILTSEKSLNLETFYSSKLHLTVKFTYNICYKNNIWSLIISTLIRLFLAYSCPLHLVLYQISQWLSALPPPVFSAPSSWCCTEIDTKLRVVVTWISKSSDNNNNVKAKKFYTTVTLLRSWETLADVSSSSSFQVITLRVYNIIHHYSCP